MRNLFLWQFFGFTFSCAVGTALHFLYSFTGILAFSPFSAVNESTFEHMKILFFPMLFFAFLQKGFSKEKTSAFWHVKLWGISLSITLIPVLFYTLTGVFGVLPAWVNVLIFFFSAGAGYALEGWLFSKNLSFNAHMLPLFILLLLAVSFVLFTFFPPNIPLFLDPVTGGYGITIFA